MADRTRRWTWDQALGGVVPPMISSLDDSGEPDAEAIERLVAYVLEGGSTGLFVLGGCGEGAWLTTRQRGRVIRGMAKAAAGRVPVLAGVMLPATGPAVEAARQAADEGAEAVVVGSPYYFPVDGGAQRRHVEAVMAATDLPALLYNIPQCTHALLSPATVGKLAEDDRVLGIKDSAGDFGAFLGFLAIRRARPGFRVLQGNEPLAAASLLQGGQGLVPGLANVAPAAFAALQKAATTGDVAEARRLQTAVDDLGSIYALAGDWLPALKGACALLGIGNGRTAPPLEVATDEVRRGIAAVLDRHGLRSKGRPSGA
jgi:4-hydroxy-tetrahydrodipicolinate synthase